VEAEFVLRMQLSQSVYELASKYLAEDIHRQEEASLGGHPPGMVGSQSAGRNDAVNMRMVPPARTIP